MLNHQTQAHEVYLLTRKGFMAITRNGAPEARAHLTESPRTSMSGNDVDLAGFMMIMMIMMRRRRGKMMTRFIRIASKLAH